MAITDLIPWKKNESNLPVNRRQEEDSLLNIRSQMNRLFDEFFEQPFGLNSFLDDSEMMGEFSPQLDISETEKEIAVSAELPGLKREDIGIALDNNMLRISGEKKAEKKEKGKHFYRVERSYGSFHRSIPLSAEVDQDKIEAVFKRGVLKVKLPKTRAAQERKRIPIKTG